MWVWFLDYLWVVIISFDGFWVLDGWVLIGYGLLLLDAFVVVFACTIWFVLAALRVCWCYALLFGRIVACKDRLFRG